MKEKLLVLDSHTNGHEAAVRFVRKMRWSREDHEMIFCGSHSNILSQLSTGPAYAVLPVYNSTRGHITSVTKEIEWYKSVGCDFQIVDTLRLSVRHCLLAQKHITDVSQIQRVFSKTEAMGQCERFLTQYGLTEEKRSKTDSTGGAARYISQKAPGFLMGAIAPRSAARAYGLKILAEDIQDNSDNTTTFHLLRNPAKLVPVTVGIIGINGKFGSYLRRFYEEIGCNVIGSDVDRLTELTNVEVAQKADVIIVSVRVRNTVEVIRSIRPYLREDQLLMDVTSVKQPAVTEMLKTRAQVVGTHPMHAPESGFAGQTHVVCLERVTSAFWKTWLVNVFARMGVVVKRSTPVEHDSYMVTVQISPQSSNFLDAWLIAEQGVSVGESLAFTSPYYRIAFSMRGRLLSQKPNLYAGIMMKNPQTLPMLRQRQRLIKQLIDIVKRQDYEAFERIFHRVVEHFGEGVVKDANELFACLIAVTKTRYGKNSVILQFRQQDDSPGLLARILRVFSRRKINLSGINSVDMNGHQMQFAISFDDQTPSAVIDCALREIGKWKKPEIVIKQVKQSIPPVVHQLFGPVGLS